MIRIERTLKNDRMRARLFFSRITIASTQEILKIRQRGSAKATTLLPDAAPFFPPPQAITTYCRPLIV